ncbi:MAG: hypothetical protein OEL66_07755, partial [Desulfobulbaceae bacterium]|nr:hypothetical protein [Desulfobulbaceae bacterium]
LIFRNFMERAAIMTPEDEISEAVVLMLLQPGAVKNKNAAGSRDNLVESLEGASFKEAKRVFEREFLLRRLQENDGNISQTAEQVGLERSHLHKKIKSFSDDDDS